MRNVFMTALLASSVLVSAQAQAQTTYTDLATWQSAVGTYNRDTVYGADSTDISSLILDDGTALSFSDPTNIRTIGVSWSTWSGGYTDQILFAPGLTSISVTFDTAVTAFGFFTEPNPFSVESFVFTLSDGTFATADYDGTGGAGFFGFTGPGITGFTLSATTDFAFGDFYTASGVVPEPAAWGMMIGGFGLAGAAMRRRRVRTTVAYA